MKVNKNLLLVALATSSFSTVAAIQDKDETLVVTANRFEQPISSVLAPMNVVTRADIDRWQATSVPEVLRRLPGITISQNGGRGQVTSVFIRGNESKHVLVLIDGVRMPSSAILLGGPDLSQIPVALIQKIEYIRGPHAATYGADAIGGVINIITESEQEVSKVNVSYGSRAYQNYNLAVQQAITDDTTISIAGGYESTSGYDVQPKANEPDKDGFRGKSIWLGANHQFSDELSGFIRGYGYANSIEYDGYYNESQLYTHNYDMGLRFTNDNYSSQLILSYQKYKIFNYNKNNGKNSESPNDVVQKSIQWGNTYHFEQGGVISGGIDFYDQSAEKGSSGLSNSHSRNNTGIYLTGQKQISDFIFEGAVRLDDNQQYGRHGTWQVAADWSFVENHNVTLSYGTAFKAPGLSETNDGAWGVIGNPDLKPEKSKQWELGFEGHYTLLDWRLSAYYNKVNNLIQWQEVVPWVSSTYVNEAEATIKGIELNINFDTGILHHNATLEYIDARNGNDQLLLKRPHKNFQYLVDMDFDDLQFTLGYLYKGESRDYGTSDSLSGYSLWDISSSYRIMPDLVVSGKVGNIFDKKYETAIGYPNAGREYIMTLSYEF